jgi:hypothetical protein
LGAASRVLACLPSCSTDALRSLSGRSVWGPPSPTDSTAGLVGMVQMVECLPHTCEALSSISQYHKNKNQTSTTVRAHVERQGSDHWPPTIAAHEASRIDLEGGTVESSPHLSHRKLDVLDFNSQILCCTMPLNPLGGMGLGVCRQPL